jgi:hypothetical protein
VNYKKICKKIEMDNEVEDKIKITNKFCFLRKGANKLRIKFRDKQLLQVISKRLLQNCVRSKGIF